MEQEEDKISNLPTIILHNIISRLWEESEKDAARTSVLSKAWLETWYTFPILSFCDYGPIKHIAGTSAQTEEDFPRKNKDFIEYVKSTLFRFWDQRLAIKEFSLELELPNDMSNDVDLCLKLASESSVEVLTLCLSNGSNSDEGLGECYVLPKGVIEVKSLTKLSLIGGIRVDQAFMNHSITFFSLIELYLWDVLFEDEQAIEHLISYCPLLEVITLTFSKGGMKSLRMHGLQKLKTVDVDNIKEVCIDDASSLVTLHYYFDKHLNTPFKIDFIQCRNLKELLLFLDGTNLTDNWFLELFKKFPFLETLEIWNCTMSERINISSVQLKLLKLLCCCNSKEVNIDAPNLLSCRFSEFGRPIISFFKSSSELEVLVEISTRYFHVSYVRELVQNIKPQNVMRSLYLNIIQPTMDAPNPILGISTPPPRIKYLYLNINSTNYETTLFPDLLHFLVLCCCPTTISFSLDTSNIAFIKFFYEKLKRRKDDDCFCTFNTKCWLHDVKGVEITTSMKIDDNVDFQTMLERLPTFGFQHCIRFKLEF